MRGLAVTFLAAVTAIVGLATDVSAQSPGRHDNDGRNPYYSGGNDYWRYGGYYGGYDGYYRRGWRRHRAYYGARYTVRRNYRGDGCMRRKYDAYGNVYFKVRRACR
jgi:hypothetical protein